MLAVFLRARFQTYAAFNYLLHNNSMLFHTPNNDHRRPTINVPCWLRNLCFSPRQRHRTVGLTEHASPSNTCCTPQ